MVQVIVAGLPRTGTTSMTSALSLLLKGKVFDGGHVSYMGSYTSQQRLLELSSHCPIKSTNSRTRVLDLLTDFTKDCVACTDQPGCYLLEEMLELYPEAKVIVTTRERESWWASYATLQTCIMELYPLSWLEPQLHRFCRFSVEFFRQVPHSLSLVNRALGEKSGGEGEGEGEKGKEDFFTMQNHEGLFEAHARYVERVVPRGQLYYFDVRDGWGPLCGVLDVPVPEGQAFPHQLKRSDLMSGHAATLRKLRIRFAVVIALGVGSVAWMAYKSYFLFQ